MTLSSRAPSILLGRSTHLSDADANAIAMAADTDTDKLNTERIKEWRSIVTLIVFVLTSKQLTAPSFFFSSSSLFSVLFDFPSSRRRQH